jgi:hypothetical protein
MPDLSPIQQVAAIIGALITATVSAAVTYFVVVKRKSATFWVSDSEDVTLPLRRHHKDIVFKVSGREFLNLNRANVFVKNTGNTSMSGFKFDIEIPGTHQQYLAELIVDDAALRNAIDISWDDPPLTADPKFHVAIASFFNKKECFKVLVYSNGETTKSKIHCRVEDVQTKIKSGPHISIADFKREHWKIVLAIGFVASHSCKRRVCSVALFGRDFGDGRETNYFVIQVKDGSRADVRVWPRPTCQSH